MKRALVFAVAVVVMCLTRGAWAEGLDLDTSIAFFQPVNGADLDAADDAAVEPGAADVDQVGPAKRTTGLLASNHDGYEGGRGLITLEGVSGMFLNPTSGTLGQGQFTAQYCAAVLRQNNDEEIQHTAMFSYGLTDWLEVGAFFRISDLDNSSTNVGAGGPLVRVRLLKDEDWLPEVSVGAMSRNGFDALTKHTVFIAASKRFVIDEDGILKSVRGHIGFRQLWQDSDVNEANGSIGYVGIDVELPYDIYFVSEVSNKDDVFNHTPFSFGLQWRPTTVLGLSIAGVQTGGEDSISFYIGIGATFEF